MFFNKNNVCICDCDRNTSSHSLLYTENAWRIDDGAIRHASSGKTRGGARGTVTNIAAQSRKGSDSVRALGSCSGRSPNHVCYRVFVTIVFVLRIEDSPRKCINCMSAPAKQGTYECSAREKDKEVVVSGRSVPSRLLETLLLDRNPLKSGRAPFQGPRSSPNDVPASRRGHDSFKRQLSSPFCHHAWSANLPN